MLRTLLVLIVLIMGGCIQNAAETDDVPARVASTAPVPTATSETVLYAATMELDATSTRGETVTLFVNATAPMDVLVKQDENVTIEEKATSALRQTLVLGFGNNSFDVTLSAPGFVKTANLNVVRLGATTLIVDFGVFHPDSQGTPRAETFEVWIDVDARPSAPDYSAQGIEHLDAFTAHDQLVVFEEETRREVEFEYFPSFEGFGVSRIDDAGSQVSSDAPPWWCYKVNDASADGISIQRVVPGDVVTWTLGSCS